MDRITEQIEWYQQNANSLYDDMVIIELEKISSLYNRYKDYTDEMFVKEMIDSFCKIMEKQREKIYDRENEVITSVEKGANVSEQEQESFCDDKQLQDAFTRYCLSKGKSSYTANDYCSRIRNLWKGFYEEYAKGAIREDLAAKLPDVLWEGALMNVYHNIDVLKEYIGDKINELSDKRNWLNSRAAVNKLDEFKSNR